MDHHIIGRKNNAIKNVMKKCYLQYLATVQGFFTFETCTGEGITNKNLGGKNQIRAILYYPTNTCDMT